MTLAFVTLWLSALMFAVFGCWLLVSPEKLEVWLQIAAGSAAGRTELRALYGGLEIGIAAFCAFAALRQDRHFAGCALVAFGNGGIAAARIFGMVADGSASGQMAAFLSTELVFAALGTIACWRLARRAG